MSLFVVVGAGPVGRETARLLAVEGHEVRLVSRAGAKPIDAGISGVALDACDGQSLARVCAGADAIFMCAMAPYTKWPTDFPPIMDGVIAAAESVKARLVVLGNIYGYGKQAGSPLTSAAPLAPTSIKGRVRTATWEQVLGSAVPAAEVRASDLSWRRGGLAVHAHDASALACREAGHHARRSPRPACLVLYQRCRASSRCGL